MSHDLPCTFPAAALDPGRRTGLILCGMGGPDGPETVEPFLRNLFSDPMIFPVPRPFNRLLGAMIAKLRTPGVKKRYLQISPDGRTPQLDTTFAQASDLARRLTDAGRPAVGGMAMRYWRPWPADTVREMLDEGCEQFLLVPTYPQYSCSTNGATLGFVTAALERVAPGRPVHTVVDWPLQEGFVRALAHPVAATVDSWVASGIDPAECAILYVAHSLPMKFIDGGDPYEKRTDLTVTEVHARMSRTVREAGHADWLARVEGGPVPRLAYQSRVGPIKWLGPEVTAEVERLAAGGIRRLHVQPVSFTCEHIETLMELDIELREEAMAAGVTDYRRGAALNLNETWLDSMARELAASAFAPEVPSHD
jgi:ferrochelatase